MSWAFVRLYLPKYVGCQCNLYIGFIFLIKFVSFKCNSRFLEVHPLWSRSVICFWLFGFFWWTIQQLSTRLRTSLPGLINEEPGAGWKISDLKSRHQTNPDWETNIYPLESIKIHFGYISDDETNIKWFDLNLKRCWYYGWYLELELEGVCIELSQSQAGQIKTNHYWLICQQLIAFYLSTGSSIGNLVTHWSLSHFWFWNKDQLLRLLWSWDI